jgi:hypothetical protein
MSYANKQTFIIIIINMQNAGFLDNINNNNDTVFHNKHGNSDDDGMATVSYSTTIETTNLSVNNERFDTELNIKIQTFRFKFTDEFNEDLHSFAKVHQYDPRNVFKEAWEVWLEDNKDSVSREVARLKNSGYEGDIVTKMFKSARYYYRKKNNNKTVQKERQMYFNVTKDLITHMDDHITCGLLEENYKPSTGFEEFCKSYQELLKGEVKQLYENGFKNSQEIKEKIKKTYKNRYFLFTKKINK